MTLYRVLKSMQSKSGVIPAGDFIIGSSYPAESLNRLEEVGAIGELHAPPLAEIPDFDGTEKLAAIGIVQADQLVEANIDEISKQLGIDTTTLREWRAEISNWLIIPARAASG